MSNDNSIPEDEYRTTLAYSSQSISKQIKVANDALVSVLNNEKALEAKSEDEHELAKQAYRDTKSAVEALYELTESLDESSDEELSVAEQFNPTVQEGGDDE